ncbi:pectinesterase-like [Cucurbita pepo subsp. pepo]|uniref:pectinesterase-like n=1 Tax=Cucurbita pepo subsp. pepo TaxID=3664 RepID=UPI000C9D27DC|nr:pectinesterase-like [Cucurbita pepo subsp. pepo]
MAYDGGGCKNNKAALVGLLSLFLVALVNGVSGAGEDPGSSNAAIKTLCEPTTYRETCEEVLVKSNVDSKDPRELVKAGFHFAIEQLKVAIANSPTLKQAATDPMAQKAVDACDELMDYAIDDLLTSFDKITDSFDVHRVNDYLENLRIWLSAALTYQETCLDGFENVPGDTGEKMKNLLKTSKEMTANGLVMVGEVTSLVSTLWEKLGLPPQTGRQLRTEESNEEFQEEEPSWVSDRRGLLEATGANIKANVVVAKDGSGKYKTITEALKEVPLKSNTTFVIHVKEGVYEEQVMVDKKMTYVMMIGDGPTKTKITASKNVADGTPTFKSATFAAIGSNFIGKDLWFDNSAGIYKGQAVALRVQSDMSIFYNCRMDGYQDTFYPQTKRQFYRDCTISGTVDFIFGNAAVVLQNCKILVRKPKPKQPCPITAQGRMESDEPTGIVLQNCIISSDPDYYPVRHTSKSYLGRPWKQYSRTVIMQCQIDDLIQPEGWLPWNGDFALNTLYYTEFENRGPGAAKENRVKWKGVKQITAKQAINFTPSLFIQGDDWIKKTGIPYTSALMKI